ncbi:MAG TPA: hypothetical protein VFI31_08535 [Pirellulales bacterium]|nr:hypothetical protein [Pirellulales bacterium]
MHVDAPTSLCQVGIARCDITPPIGIYHRMWGAAAHDRSTGVHRPLTATALVLRPAPAPHDCEQAPALPAELLVLIAVDHCLLWGDEMSAVLTEVSHASGVPRERLLIMFSHTHGAGLMGRERSELPGGEMIAPYLKSLSEKLADLVVQAGQELAPAIMTYGRGRCSLAAHRDLWDAGSGQWVCGYHPQGPADDTLVIARITDFAGHTRGVVVNYACHPTTLAWQNTLISPDYVGAMRELVEEATSAPCFFIQGASGDLGPQRGYTGDVRIADANGRQLGHAVLSALEALPPPGTRYQYAGPVVSGAVIGVWNDVPLDNDALLAKSRWQYRYWTVPLEYRAGLPTLEALTAQREQHLADEADARSAGDEALASRCRAKVEVATRQLVRFRGRSLDRPYLFPIHLWQIGDAFWVAAESEHYQLLQAALRQHFADRVIVVGTIVNGSLHTYLPPRDVYGTGIYQDTVALLAPGSLERLIEEIAGQIASWQGH